MKCAMKKTHRLFTLLMVLLMVLSMLSVAASAEDIEVRTVVTDTSDSIRLSDLFPKTEETEGLEETEEIPEPIDSVRIFSSFTGVIRLGDPVTLTSEVKGEVAGYQWECDKGDGFEAIEGANEATYSFAATAESLCWDWRLTVTRPVEEIEAETPVEEIEAETQEE